MATVSTAACVRPSVQAQLIRGFARAALVIGLFVGCADRHERAGGPSGEATAAPQNRAALPTVDPIPAAYALDFEAVQLTGFDFGAELRGATVGDFDADGRRDVIVSADAALYTLHQTERGELKEYEPVYLSIAASARHANSLVVADFNADGRDDVAVNLQLAAGVAYQTEEGRFEKVETYTLSTKASSDLSQLARGDFNHDGRNDLIAISWGAVSQQALIALQLADGGFAPAFEYAIPHAGYDDLAVGDVNGDGRDDVVVTSRASNVSCAVALQNDSGGFHEPLSFMLDIGPGGGDGVAVGDITGDGLPEIVLSYGGSNPSIGVLRLDATGQMVAFTSYPATGGSGHLVIEDINADGRDDVVMQAGDLFTVSVFVQDATGALVPEQPFRVPYANQGKSLAIADLDSDGRSDILIAVPSGLSVLYQRTP